MQNSMNIHKLARIGCTLPWLLSGVFWLGQPATALADEYIETVRVTCVPEIPLFSIEYLSINDNAGFMQQNWFRTHNDAAAWRQLRKYGYLPASKFDAVCKLPKATYRVWGHMPERQPRGECGGDPRPVLSLSREDKILLSRVYLLESCIPRSSGGHVNAIMVHGETEGNAEVLEMQLRDQDGRSEDLWHIKTTLDQETLDCLVSKPGYLRGGGAIYDAQRDCGVR
ncbi:hypothetical protein ABAC460_07230 [Asticcacaulis sp. AC460]|uniref:hypothetical protein n=1 Tax=Asticcacaulis sp. AC460 TaxID=1282360 RepID=UPI0003C3F086|nr:hypothetical protein [Asticcacaulis sp. AC460]ESQ91352.1 hypothetical protein ABAC460_07230 [Asticcacaulis sp. AC460]